MQPNRFTNLYCRDFNEYKLKHLATNHRIFIMSGRIHCEICPLAAFTSPDGNHITLTGMNATEKNVRLYINFKDFGVNLNSNLAIYITNTTAKCKQVSNAVLKNKSVSVLIPAHTMFTATTLK